MSDHSVDSVIKIEPNCEDNDEDLDSASAIKIEPKFEPNCEVNYEDVLDRAIKIKPNCEDQNDEDCKTMVFEERINEVPIEWTSSTNTEGKTVQVEDFEKKSTYTRQFNGIITKEQDVKGNKKSTRLEEKKSLDTFKSEVKPSISKCSENVSTQIKDEPAVVKTRRTVRVKNENMTIQEVIKLFQSEYISSSSAYNFYRKYSGVKPSCEKYLIYRCRLCASEFDQVDSAEVHFEKEHPNSDTGTESNKEDDFLNHFYKLYKCDQCGMAAPILLSFIKHLESLHYGEGRKYSCDKCSFFTLDWHSFWYHKKSHEKNETSSKKTKCHLCHLWVYKIKCHLKQKHSNNCSNKIKCPLCPKTFDCMSVAIKHRNSAHAVIGSNNLICKECGRTYKNAESFRKHLRSHDKTRPHFDCSLCKRKFKTKTGFYLHMNTIHQSIGNGVKSTSLLYCLDCGKAFDKERTLLNHIRKEHDPTCEEPEKKHLCETCGKSFQDKFFLDRHMIVHTKEKKFVCATCNKGFTQMDSLKTHQVVHTGIKPFECGKCGQKYSQKYPLTIHVKKHHPDE